MIVDVKEKIWSVTEINEEIKTILKNNISSKIIVQGEVSNYKGKSNNSIYFNLIDGSSSEQYKPIIRVVMWSSIALYNKIELKDGIKINVIGKITTYQANSCYQIDAQKFELVNKDGELLKIIEERKKRLEKDGLFDLSKKKPIPKTVQIAGIITAEESAAYKDVLKQLENRLSLKLILYPSIMQGKNSPASIIKGIKYFNSLKENIPQVIIITRGGGSVEDLMAFNDEELAREAFNSNIPIISAIGHEIDFTILDFVSDLRVPTPTAVPQALTITKEEASNRIKNAKTKMFKILLNYNTNKQEMIIYLITKLIKNKYDKYIQILHKIEIIYNKLENIIKTKIINNYNKFKNIQSFHKRIIFLFKVFVNKYIQKLEKIKKINILEYIKTFIQSKEQKIQNIQLKFESIKNILKTKINLKSQDGQEIIFKNQLDIKNTYILNFSDGSVKIKIIE